MRSLCLIFVVFVSLGLQSNALNTRLSTYIDVHSDKFFELMKSHFDISLEYLFTSNAYNDRTFERPGMGKLLREQSDRHWNLGVATLRKYIQRGGKTFPHNDEQTSTAQKALFTENFAFGGANAIKSDHKTTPDFSKTYLVQMETLVSNSQETASKLNHLHRMTMQRKHIDTNNSDHDHYDADIGHYLEEQLEEEVGLMRKFSNLYTSLAQMINLGMAVHFFDKNL